MSRSQFQSKRFILRHAWLNLWDERMTTGRINQVAVLKQQLPTANSQSIIHFQRQPTNTALDRVLKRESKASNKIQIYHTGSHSRDLAMSRPSTKQLCTKHYFSDQLSDRKSHNWHPYDSQNHHKESALLKPMWTYPRNSSSQETFKIFMSRTYLPSKRYPNCAENQPEHRQSYNKIILTLFRMTLTAQMIQRISIRRANQ